MSDMKNLSLEELQTLRDNAEVSKIEALARQAELNLAQRLAAPWEARVLALDTALDVDTVSNAVGVLDQWRLLDAGKDGRKVKLYVNSDSPSIINTLALVDYIRWMKMDGFEVDIQVAGKAGNNTAVLLQEATPGHRIMTPNSWIGLQELTRGFQGNTFEGSEIIKFHQRLQRQARALLAANSKLTTADIRRKTARRELWLGADAALEAGLVDQVGCASCFDEYDTVLHLPVTDPSEPADVRKKKAELRKWSAETQIEALNLRNAETDPNNTFRYRFFSPVDKQSCLAAKQAFGRWARRSGSKMTLMISSGGGSIVDGFGFIDYARQIQCSGHEINTEVLGWAASMGGVMLQLGKHRVMGKNSWLLIHMASRWFEGSTAELLAQQDLLVEMQNQCFELLASRSKLTVEEIRKRCEHANWWLSADEALKLGFCDEVR